MQNKNRITIIDVRTPGEFRNGSVEGSINIPLQEIPNGVEEIRQMPHPIVICCASGNRSEKATRYLRSQGIQCDNGGSWIDLNNSQNKYHFQP